MSLAYHSPHKFRHGHAVYAIKLAKNIAALKAVSQNLTHSNLSTTDGVYGILSEYDVKREIAAIGVVNSSREANDLQALLSLTKQLVKKLETGDTSH